MEKKTIRTHRVGTVTLGLFLVVLGVSFLLNMLFDLWGVWMIFRMWPIALVLLGMEVLLGTRHKTYEVIGNGGEMIEQHKVIYDVPAIVLTACTFFFTWMLAWADWAYLHQVMEFR